MQRGLDRGGEAEKELGRRREERASESRIEKSESLEVSMEGKFAVSALGNPTRA